MSFFPIITKSVFILQIEDLRISMTRVEKETK